MKGYKSILLIVTPLLGVARPLLFQSEADLANPVPTRDFTPSSARDYLVWHRAEFERRDTLLEGTLSRRTPTDPEGNGKSLSEEAKSSITSGDHPSISEPSTSGPHINRGSSHDIVTTVSSGKLPSAKPQLGAEGKFLASSSGAFSVDSDAPPVPEIPLRFQPTNNKRIKGRPRSSSVSPAPPVPSAPPLPPMPPLASLAGKGLGKPVEAAKAAEVSPPSSLDLTTGLKSILKPTPQKAPNSSKAEPPKLKGILKKPWATVAAPTSEGLSPSSSQPDLKDPKILEGPRDAAGAAESNEDPHR